jgi:hypothetical protein
MQGPHGRSTATQFAPGLIYLRSGIALAAPFECNIQDCGTHGAKSRRPARPPVGRV